MVTSTHGDPCSASTRRRLLDLLAGGLGTLALPALARGDVPQSEASREPVQFGVFPYLPALEIGRKFGPMASALSAVVERPVGLRTKSDFPAFQTALLDAHYDIALVHPFFYQEVAAVHDYQPLARLEDDLAAVIVGPAHRRIESFADLAGETIAVPPALSGVTRLVALELHRQKLDGLNGVQLAHYRTKTACLQAVINGRAPACAVPGFILGQLAALSATDLEPRFETSAIPGILFVGHARLGRRSLQELAQTLVSWNGSSEGRRLLSRLGWSGILPIPPGQYDMADLDHVLE